MACVPSDIHQLKQTVGLLGRAALQRKIVKHQQLHSRQTFQKPVPLTLLAVLCVLRRANLFWGLDDEKGRSCK